MAREFNGVNQSLQSAGNLSTINGASRITVGMWLYTTYVADNDVVLETSANSNAVIGAFKVLANESGSNELYVDTIGNVGRSSGSCVAPSNNAWHHILFQIDYSKPTDEIDSIYIDGVSQALTRTNNNNNTNTFGNFALNVMSRDNAALFADGRMAELAVWTPASLFAAADVAQLAAGYSPQLVRPDELVNHWPLIGRFSPEIDPVGGLNLTVNSATTQDHPRIIVPASSLIEFKATATPEPPTPPTPPTVTINLTQSPAAIVTGVGVCVVEALDQTPAGAPARQCLLLPTYTIPWDDCDCGGQVALAIQQIYGSSRFPQPGDLAGDWSRCGPAWSVVQVLVSVIRCVPTMNDQGQPPACADSQAAAVTLEYDRLAVRTALACCLTQLKTSGRIGQWALQPSVTVGELGGCAGVETIALIGFRSCLCGTH